MLCFELEVMRARWMCGDQFLVQIMFGNGEGENTGVLVIFLALDSQVSPSTHSNSLFLQGFLGMSKSTSRN